jgi:hypothetical protein
MKQLQAGDRILLLGNAANWIGRAFRPGESVRFIKLRFLADAFGQHSRRGPLCATLRAPCRPVKLPQIKTLPPDSIDDNAAARLQRRLRCCKQGC